MKIVGDDDCLVGDECELGVVGVVEGEPGGVLGGDIECD